MLTMASNAMAMIFFGGVRLAHGAGDGFGFMLLGLAGLGVAIWGIARVTDSDFTKK